MCGWIGPVAASMDGLTDDRRPDASRRRILRFGLPLLALPWLRGVALAETPPPGGPAEPLPFEEVADGVFVHCGAVDLMRAGNEGAIANLGFVVGREAVAVIDTGGSVREGRRILAAVAQVTDRPVRYVVNTHMHPDHVFGNAAFLGDDRVFVGHRNLGPALAARRESYLLSQREPMGTGLMAEISIVPPTLSVEEEAVLDLGGRSLRLRAWPTAHTDNDLTVLDEPTGTLFAGDLAFLEHCPTLDGSALGWLGVLDELERLGAERVVPGHGPAALRPGEAFADTRRYLETLVADLRAAIAAGEPLRAAVAKAARTEATRWRLFAHYNERNATAAFAELEWE